MEWMSGDELRGGEVEMEGSGWRGRTRGWVEVMRDWDCAAADIEEGEYGYMPV